MERTIRLTGRPGAAALIFLLIATLLVLAAGAYGRKLSQQTQPSAPPSPATAPSPGETHTAVPNPSPPQSPAQQSSSPAATPSQEQTPASPAQSPAPSQGNQPSPAQSPAPSNTPSPSQSPAPSAPTPAITTPAPPASPVLAAPGAALSFSPQVSPASITLDQAVQFALKQASAYQQAQLSEQIAAADVKQARIALLPRINSPLAYTYNTPSNGTPPAGHGMPTPQSFINLNAVSEYQAFLGMTGEVDVSGRLRATIRRNQALLEAAHAGTEIARRALVAATVDAYYGLALATARRRVAELSLASAQDFERATALLLSGGEVASVDLVRARLQTAARRDELEQAHAAEAAAADGLRILVGYDFSTPIAAVDLLMLPPQDGEIEGYTAKAISRRPEFAQFEAERRAAEEDIKIARDERRPQVTYTFNGGFDSDSVYPTTLRSHTGVSGAVNVTVPLFDFGASRSRELQARLRAEQFNSERIVALRNFAQQFYAARSQALTALTRINLVRASVVDAERNLQTSIARYRAGEAPILEVTDAQSTLAAQRTALYQAIYDYQTARAHLAQAVGQ